MIKSRITEEYTIMNRVVIATLVTVVVSLFTVGCATKYHVSTDNYPPDRDRYDISMDLTYLNEEALIERFGERSNPYLNPSSIIGANELTVFEVEVMNRSPLDESGKSSVVVHLDSIRLLYGGKAVAPVNSFHLGRFWEDKLGHRSSSSDRGTTQSERYGTPSKMKYVIEESMYPSDLTLEPGSEYSGIIAFMGRFPAWGDGAVHIPVFTEEKQVIGVFKDDFQFE
jgi:hypothetical protein